MIHSMTGYGKSVLELSNKTIRIEIRSLNSKSLDLNVRTPVLYRVKELELRKLIGSRLKRGKVDFSLYVEYNKGETPAKINQKVVQNYIQQLKTIAEAEDSELLKMAVRMPDALSTDHEDIDALEWDKVSSEIAKTLDNIEGYRKDEGLALEQDFIQRIANIKSLLKEVTAIDPERVEHVRQRLNKGVADLKENIDQLYSVYIIGGEPTVNPEFKKFLRDCVETNNAGHIDLRFNTNGQILDEELKELYTHFKSVTLHLSMDGTHDRYTYIRHPGTWQNQLDSLHWHDQLSNNVNVGIDCTAMALNAWHLPDFIVWKMNQKFKNITVYPNFGGMIGLHILWQPPLLSVQVLPKELKEEILVRYNNVIKWANTHHQPREGKGVNKHNR